MIERQPRPCICTTHYPFIVNLHQLSNACSGKVTAIAGGRAMEETEKGKRR